MTEQTGTAEWGTEYPDIGAETGFFYRRAGYCTENREEGGKTVFAERKAPSPPYSGKSRKIGGKDETVQLNIPAGKCPCRANSAPFRIETNTSGGEEPKEEHTNQESIGRNPDAAGTKRDILLMTADGGNTPDTSGKTESRENGQKNSEALYGGNPPDTSGKTESGENGRENFAVRHGSGLSDQDKSDGNGEQAVSSKSDESGAAFEAGSGTAEYREIGRGSGGLMRFVTGTVAGLICGTAILCLFREQMQEPLAIFAGAILKKQAESSFFETAGGMFFTAALFFLSAVRMGYSAASAPFLFLLCWCGGALSSAAVGGILIGTEGKGRLFLLFSWLPYLMGAAVLLCLFCREAAFLSGKIGGFLFRRSRLSPASAAERFRRQTYLFLTALMGISFLGAGFSELLRPMISGI